MEILRVPPYSNIAVNYTVPSGYSSVDIFARITDMADLSTSILEFLDSNSGDVLSASLPGRYDSDYRLEFYTVSNTVENTINEDYYEVIRPYVNPSDKGTTSSEISAYSLNEEIARAIIDSMIPRGFYYKKKVLNIIGNGSDFLPVWEDVKKVLSVYENNKLIEDRTYQVTSDKTAIVESTLENVNRAESAPLVLPAASSDSLSPQFVYKGFANTYDYRITIEHGYVSVPSDIVRATEMLVHDLECGKLDYYKRFVTSYNTDQYRIQFDKSLFQGTGNIIVDKILSKYSSSVTKLGVL